MKPRCLKRDPIPRQNMPNARVIYSFLVACIMMGTTARSEDYRLLARSTVAEGEGLVRVQTPRAWKPEETAFIVCDVWDYHHSINAVRRLEEILPRMDAMLAKARERGSIVIHSPSDCMPAYEGHEARLRAIAVPKAPASAEIASWCCRIPAEERAVYPVDQSDGGEDDDPTEHREWAAKLKALGRNPAMPWKTESLGLQIDATKDYISDRGDEVWNILKDRKIKHVVMAGVHTNMCVLGRPFGLRKMVQQGIETVLVRDLTDCMYNPASWPFVDHFTGNDLVITHVERFVCPTITSDQLVGGEPIQYREDRRLVKDVVALPADVQAASDRRREWSFVQFPKGLAAIVESRKNSSKGEIQETAYLRCSLSISAVSLEKPMTLKASGPVEAAWLNGKALKIQSQTDGETVFSIEKSQTFGNDDANLLVLRYAFHSPNLIWPRGVEIQTQTETKSLEGTWQIRLGTSKTAHEIPLPAKFGATPEIFYSVR